MSDVSGNDVEYQKNDDNVNGEGVKDSTVDFDEIKEKTQHVAEQVTEEIKKVAQTAKEVYDKAGGVKGISETVADTLGKAAGTIHKAYDKVQDAKVVKSTAQMISDTDVAKKFASGHDEVYNKEKTAKTDSE